jgi:hypothetical protein
MQPDVLPFVLEALSKVEPGERQPALAGLWVAPLMPLLDVREAQAVRLRSASPGGTLSWIENSPPDPGRVRAHNLSAGAAVVEVGTVLSGGMSTRAVFQTRVVPPGAVMPIAVESLGARWWDEGALRPYGRLAAVGTALLLQAAYGEVAAAWSARTALWALPDFSPSSDLFDDAVAATQQIGWALLTEKDVLAAWLPSRPRDAAVRSRSLKDPQPRTSRSSLLATIENAVIRGTLSGRLIGDDVLGGGLALFPHDLRLVDRVISAVIR